MHRYRIHILLSIFCFHQLYCLGTEQSFSRLSVDNGLSNNSVNTIFKDSNGFVWIGTLDGIDRYDGVEIRPYSDKFSGGIESVQTIHEDLHKNLWVGTTAGLFRYDQQVDSFKRVSLSPKHISIQTLAMLPDSNLYVGTANGLYIVNINSIKSKKVVLPSLLGDQHMSITGIFQDYQGVHWITTSQGLVRYSISDKKCELFRSELMPQTAYNSFTAICGIGTRLYLGTANAGIVEFDLSNKVFAKGTSTDNKIILNVTSDNKELIYVGTNGGGLKIINVNTREIESIVTDPNDSESLSSNSIYSFYLDKEGRYWIGTYAAGLCFTKNVKENFKLHRLTVDYPEVNKSIRSFYFSPNGAEYFGTRNGFAQLTKNGKLNYFQSSLTKRTGLRSNIILSIYPFKNDLLIGTYGGGVSRFSIAEQKMKPFLESSALSQGNVYAFATDHADNLWITSFSGLYRYSVKDRSLVNFNTQNSDLKSDQIFEITFDSQERIWVGSMSGTSVYAFKNNRLELLDLSVIPDNTFKTNHIYEDLEGNIWICTERGGLTMIDSSLTQSNTFLEENGLPDNSVCSIIEGSPGEYWVSTLKGLCKYSIPSRKFTKHFISEGLPSLVFTPAATYRSSEGTIFLGNEKGLIYFDPGEVNGTSFSSRILFTDLFISGKKVNPGKNLPLNKIIEETDEVRLNEQMNNIGFRFVVLNYINPADNNYRYKLEGYDKDWRNNGSNNTVFYQNLKPGDYTFKVGNVNNLDNELASHVEVKIHIHRTFFNSLYFYVLLLSLGLACAFFLIRYIRGLPNKIKQKIDLSIKPEKYKGAKISKNRGDLIIHELKKHMSEKKLYLNPGLKLADLSSDTNYPMNEISQVLNQDLQQSFSDFVNKYRVEEVKKLMSMGEHEKFTLVAIAKQCGFNSKTSFYRVFKKETGKTPADYLKDLNPHNEIV